MADQQPPSASQPEATPPAAPVPAATGGSAHKRLHRSRQHRIIFGVCGGLADYFDVDATLVRLLFVLLAFVSGAGILIYLVLLIVMPNEQHLDSHPREAVRGTMGEVASDTRSAVGSATSWTKSKLGRDKQEGDTA